MSTALKYGLLGKKIGMTRIYDEKGRSIPVTVVDVGGNALLQVKTPEKDGYSAIQLGYGAQKEQRVNKPALARFQKAGSEPKRFIAEFRLNAGDKVEGELPLKANLFQPGQLVDVIGQSKGKGFQGIMRKHGAQGQPASHGSMMHRRPGSIGCRSTPGRIWKNQSMPGHMGDERITVQNLEVVQVRDDQQLLLIRGAVPGASNGFVVVRPAKKAAFPYVKKEEVKADAKADAKAKKK